MQIRIKIVREGAVIPKRATDGSAGADLSACIPSPVIIPANGRALIPTGIALELPETDLVAYVFARSGLAVNCGVALSNGVGVIDSDYRGEVQVGLFNSSEKDFTVEPGMRIAQLVVERVIKTDFVTAESLSGTERGAGGFGSTGL